MDLSKAYGFLSHDLMVAKLEVYGLAKESLHIISDSLSYRKQRTKIGYSGWANIIRGIPQCSISGPLLLNIFIIMTLFLSLKSQTFVISQMIAICFPMTATFP